MKLTPGQRGARAAARTHHTLLIHGARASGRTTALLHAAMEVIGLDEDVPAHRVWCLTRGSGSVRSATSLLERLPALRQMTLGSAYDLARNLYPEHDWERAPLPDSSRDQQRQWAERNEAASMEAKYRIDADRPEAASYAQKASDLRTELAYRAELDMYRRTIQHRIIRTRLDTVLKAVHSLAAPPAGKLTRQPALLLVDDWDDLSLPEQLLVEHLLRRCSMRIFLTAWAPVSSLAPLVAHTAALPERLNRGEILLLLHHYAPKPQILPARGFGGHITVGDVLPCTTEDDCALELKHRYRADLLDYATRGKSVAVVIAEQRAPAAWEQFNLRSAVKTAFGDLNEPFRAVASQATPADVAAHRVLQVTADDQSEERLTALLECACRVSGPGGGYPLLIPAFRHVSGSMSRTDRAQLHTAWKNHSTRLPHPEFNTMHRRLQFCRTTADVIDAFAADITRSDITAEWAERHPHPAGALAALHALHRRPDITIIGLPTHPVHHLYLIIPANRVDRDMILRALDVTLDHVHLIPASPDLVMPPDHEVSRLLEKISGINHNGRILAGEFPVGRDVGMYRRELRQMFRTKALEQYFATQWPDHVTPATLARLEALLGEDTPAAWRERQRPSTVWQARVSLLDDYGL